MAKVLSLIILGLILYSCTLESEPDFKQIPNEQVGQTDSEPKPIGYCEPLNFRYVIVDNALLTYKVRNVKIFMDVNAFNEKNLSSLFSLLSIENPKPQHLTIEVFTSWKQVPLRVHKGCEGTGISEVSRSPSRISSQKATYYRREGREYFRYQPSRTSDNVKTVRLGK